MKYKIYTDGACSNNGKENPVGGSAYVVLDEKENIILEKAFKIEPATNNICELKALIEGCSAISSILRFNDSVIVYSDSAYCINAYKQKLKENDLTQPENEDELNDIPIEPFKTNCEYCSKKVTTCGLLHNSLTFLPFL